jgi:hypothetical protein
MGQDFTSSYEDTKLDEIEKTAAAPTRNLADQIEGEVIP